MSEANAAGGLFKKIGWWINTPPALRATPPHLMRGERCSSPIHSHVVRGRPPLQSLSK